MGVQHAAYLYAQQVYGCNRCRTHLTTRAEFLSHSFTGKLGSALLVNHVINVTPGPPEERTMRTGHYTVQDLACSTCGLYLGWYYVRAFEADSAYKENKWILEKERIIEVP